MQPMRSLALPRGAAVLSRSTCLRKLPDKFAKSSPCRSTTITFPRDLKALEGHWRLAGGKPCAAPGGEPSTNCALAGAPESPVQIL